MLISDNSANYKILHIKGWIFLKEPRMITQFLIFSHGNGMRGEPIILKASLGLGLLRVEFNETA